MQMAGLECINESDNKFLLNQIKSNQILETTHDQLWEVFVRYHLSNNSCIFGSVYFEVFSLLAAARLKLNLCPSSTPTSAAATATAAAATTAAALITHNVTNRYIFLLTPTFYKDTLPYL